MNNAATSGKNLQTVFYEANKERGNEMKAAALSQPNVAPQPVLYSLATRQRWPSLPSNNGFTHNPYFSAGRLRSHEHKASYGNRKLRYRWLENLKPWQVHQLHVADSIAKSIGFPLTTFVTIFWAATFPGQAAMASTFRRGMKRMCQWLRDNGVKRCAFVYIHENPGDERLNSHMLVHVPSRLRSAFNTRVGNWFNAMDGGVQAEPRNDTQRREGRLQYMAKGADDFTCRRYGGRRAKGGQGPISIKRSGVAQCLRPKFSVALKREAVA